MSDSLRSALAARETLFWINQAWLPLVATQQRIKPAAALHDALARFQWHAPLLAALFPELEETKGIIDSPLRAAPSLRKSMDGRGRWLIKCDHALPVAGSIKARGGIYEVLVHAETVAAANGLQMRRDPDSRKLGAPEARALFAAHTVTVGSTGNL